jgi:hypothetical protein
LTEIVDQELTSELGRADLAAEDKAEFQASQGRVRKLAKKIEACEQQVAKSIGFSKQIYSTDPQTIMRKKSISSASTLIKKVKTTLLEVISLRSELEKIMADVSPEDLGELKLNEWENYTYELDDHLAAIKDEVQTLISSTTAFLNEDKHGEQKEIVKVAGQAKKLRSTVDEVIKELAEVRKAELSLEDLISVHQRMTETEINLDDTFRNLRQICLKGLSQFADDYSLQKVRDLCTKLAQFSFVNFPKNLLHDFQKDSYKQELTSSQL